MQILPGLNTAIAKTVRIIRVRSGLSQEQFADFAGLSRVYIAQLETGERGASLNALILIARSVRMTGAELVALIEEEIQKLPH
ncbi:helix-turn-helix transcriptional regulator [Desulfovibrio sp. 86]|uniref:Transcriptional regulator, XRE family n=1 Tax=uncultured Desulfovibrio sp. TaxID=167968 RepID=A0A212L0W1_9BACT|nr:helix-turn-helix transcriptional regulator [Desulfovibrio sp. 86]SCM71127.1 Transcriptional regulator, XRE family [uncultured Desulfovibrio sp.]VZH32754.1 Transcriptional regulator, XRE family [Desulfovibrio sp. 86]